ncbi:MAG: DMT family transporter [Oscillospiraceae bacterium]|nr:DMT family transporter [Oscillospiraceae bacterium]
MLNQSNKGSLCIVAAAICWSLGGLCFQFIPWNAMSIIGLRALLAAVVFAIFRKSVKVKLSKGNIMAALFLSVTTMLFVFANQLTTAAAAVMLQFTAPVFVLLIQFVFYKKRPRLGEILAVIVTLFGIVLFFADDLDTGHMLGNILAIISGLTFACIFVCNRRPDTQPEQSVMLGFLINAVLWTPFALFDPNITADIVPWVFIVIMGVVQVGLAYVFFTVGIKRTPALLAILIVALEPVLNPIWVALFTPQRPGPFAILGGAVIVVTIVTYNLIEAKSAKKEAV